MIKFSTRLPFCTCFCPAWTAGKLWLSETWKMVSCYWPYSHRSPLLNLKKVAILTRCFYNVTHFFQTWNLAQSDILPKWFSLKKIVSILALVQILADVIQKAQANSTVLGPLPKKGSCIPFAWATVPWRSSRTNIDKKIVNKFVTNC